LYFVNVSNLPTGPPDGPYIAINKLDKDPFYLVCHLQENHYQDYQAIKLRKRLAFEERMRRLRGCTSAIQSEAAGMEETFDEYIGIGGTAASAQIRDHRRHIDRFVAVLQAQFDAIRELVAGLI